MSGDAEDHAEATRVVRPYTVTGGRTRPSGMELPIEALVQRGDVPVPPDLRLERLRIVEMCGDRMLSVAEIAAHLALPLGVVRVLVSDLAHAGLLVVHPGAYSTAEPSADNLDPLASVLDGISKL